LYLPKKVILFPRKRLPSTLRIGEVISIVGKDDQVRPYKLLGFHGDMASLDGNHPLAGQDLVFEIETLMARDATSEEITESCNFMSTQILH
ncbi:MAG TPA: hypothetical protein VM432_11845, partial [Bdellovibrionales bacterium]|nr:hypothetical protein [Bdellovibrionales bacterium]